MVARAVLTMVPSRADSDMPATMPVNMRRIWRWETVKGASEVLVMAYFRGLVASYNDSFGVDESARVESASVEGGRCDRIGAWSCSRPPSTHRSVS